MVISNCVINLSPDKRQTFHEIFRILKPGGRMVVSDIVTDGPIPVSIKNNEKFRGECLGGALQQEELIAMLQAAGFTAIRLIKRFPYRTEGDIFFYSLTFAAFKPDQPAAADIVYRGPFAALCLEDGTLLRKGERITVPLSNLPALDDSIFLINKKNQVQNLTLANDCCVSQSLVPLAALAPPNRETTGASCCGADNPTSAGKIVTLPTAPSPGKTKRHRSGCMACGAELTYLQHEQTVSCYFCGRNARSNALCANQHFICDDCHQSDALSAIKVMCLETDEKDMLRLLQKIRQHPAIPMHGPEHHAIVPGVILATYRNRGGDIVKEDILTGIDRGSKVPGGACGFWGSCGAAIGVGIAFSVLFSATPLTASARQTAQQTTAKVLARIAETTSGRCCQRESVTALMEAAAISRTYLPVALLAEKVFPCRQSAANKECIRKRCSLWDAKANAGEKK